MASEISRRDIPAGASFRVCCIPLQENHLGKSSRGMSCSCVSYGSLVKAVNRAKPRSPTHQLAYLVEIRERAEQYGY